MFELDDSFYETEPEAVQVPYAEERGTTMDIIHDIYTGVGETADLIGRGIGSETVQGIGESMLKSPFARPDISQYYNTDSRVGRVVDGIVRSLPTTAVLGGATALASVLTTPVGGAATFAAGLGVIGHGTYDSSLERIKMERPDLSEAEQKKYAAIDGWSEAGTEALGWLVPFGIGKSAGRALSGAATKKLTTALMDSGRVTSDQVIASTIKRIGAKESIAGLFGGAVADGTSEVANELIQSANRDSVGLDSSLPDLVDVFLIGSAPGGVIAGGTMAMSQRHKTIVRNKLNEGLASDDIDTRMNTLDTISMGLSKIDPEIGDSYKSNMLDKVQAGPVSLETLVETPEESIINNPDPTLQAEGIPTNSNPIDTATTAKPVVEGTSLEGTSPEGTPLEGTLLKGTPPEGTSLEAAQGAVVPDAPNGIGAQESVVTTPPQVAPTRYQKAVEAMSQEPARKAAVERGIQEIETQTQELATNTGLSLKQRKKLSKNIEENRKLVEEEVADVLNEPKVEEPAKKPIVITKAGEPIEVAEEPIVITEVGEPTKKPIVITKVGEPTKEPIVTTKVEPIKVTKSKAVKPIKIGPAKVEPEEADSTPLSPEGIQEAMSMSSNGFTPEESFAMAKEGIKADVAISLKKQKVPNKYIAALAKKNITKVTVPVEALRTNKEGSNKLARAEWTDGTIVESAKTKALRWKVIGKDGLERRAPNLAIVRKAIESGKVSELEPFENKTTREKKTDSITRPLTEEEQQTITEYLLDSVNNPKATNPNAKPVKRVEVTPEEMAKLVVKMGAGKLKPNVARDIMNSGSVLYKALTYEMSENGGLTDEGVRAMIVRLLNEEQNASDAAKKSKEGISREVTSYDTILDKEEVKAHGVKPEKQVELSGEGEELEGELTGELTEEGTDTDTEVMDDVEEESGIGAAPREEREFSGIEAAALKEKGSSTEKESKSDPTQYTQEDKGKYQTFKEWREPKGEKATAAEHSKEAKVFYVTKDKRYVLEPKKDENNRVSFELWKNGKDTGESFNNPEEAMEWAKDSDIEEDTPSQGEAIAEASKKAYGLEEAIKKLKALSPSEDIQEAISILEKEAAPKEEPEVVEEPKAAEKPVRKKGIRRKKKTEEAKTEEPATKKVIRRKKKPEEAKAEVVEKPKDMDQKLREVDTLSAAVEVARDNIKDPLVLMFLDRIKGSIKDVPFELIDKWGVQTRATKGLKGLEEGAKGIAWATEGRTKQHVLVASDKLFDTGDNIAIIVAHEATHVATMTAMYNANTVKMVGTPKGNAIKAIKEIRHDLIKYQESIDTSKLDKLTRISLNEATDDVYELVSYGITDKNIRSMLKEIKGKNDRTLFSKFISAVRDLLGLNISEANGLSRLLEAVDILVPSEGLAPTEEYGLKEEKNPEALKPLQQKEANEKIKAGKLDISAEANKLAEKYMSNPRGFAGGIAELYKLEDSPAVERAVEILQVLRETEPAPVGTFATRWKNGLVTLEWLANNSGAIDNVTQELAKFLLKNVDHHKLESVVVEFDNKDHYQKGIVYFGYTTRYSTMLHEIVHGITSEVMNSDGEFSNEVTALRKFVLAHAKKTGAITEEEARGLAISKTSADYIENVGIKEINLAYGLVNNKEFLAMAFSDEHFQTLLKSIKMENSTLFHRVVAAIAKALGLGKDYTALEEAINLVPAITKGKEAYSASQDIADFDLAPPKVDERVPRTDEEVSAIMAGKGPKEKIREKLFEKGKDIMAFANDALRPISDRIEARSEKIYGSLMAMETRLKLKQREYSRKVKPFMTWYKGLTESQKTRYDLALMNSNTSENQGILKEIPTAIMSNVREVLEDLRQRSEDVGLGTENKEFYFPRRVHDVSGLIEHTNKDHEYKGPMALAFKEEMKKLGVKELTEEQKTQVITDVLQRGYMRQLPRPGARKKRTVPFVDRGSYEFYSNSSDSLMGHIYEMNEKVGQREFIGGSTRKKRIQALLADMRHINKMKDGPKRQAAIAEYDIRARELEDLEKDLSDGVSALIYQQLGREPANVQNEVIDLINARMRQRGANGIVDFMRNVGYATTMGNFMSAITQLGDIPILLYYYGVNKDSLGAVGTAFKNVYKIAKGDMHGKLGETDAFVDQVDFLDTLREFSSNSMSAATVDKLFKYSGLKYADLIGKEAFMQAGYKHYQKKQNKEEFLKKYKPMFGNKVQEVWQKFQLGKKTDEDVLTVLVSELTKFQPATLSQQSKMYLVGGNARVFWMLKTFTLRSTSAALREGVNEINKGNTAKGVAKVAIILALYSAAGAGADELKDIIRGKESGFLDNTMDNMLQMLFMSKYSLETGFKKGAPLKTLVADNLIPPLRFADDFLTDVASLTGVTDKEFKAKSLKSVPFIGNIAYSRSSAGQAGYASQERTAILEEVKSNRKKQRGAYAGGLSERIRKYNQTATEKITSSTIQRAYKGDTK
ncbi:MAG: hypothetical protein WC148_03465 [Bacilli bacterium]